MEHNPQSSKPKLPTHPMESDTTENQAKSRKSDDAISEISTAVDPPIAPSQRSVWSSIASTLRPTRSTTSITPSNASVISSKHDKDKNKHSSTNPPPSAEQNKIPPLSKFLSNLRQHNTDPKTPKPKAPQTKKPRRDWFSPSSEYVGGHISPHCSLDHDISCFSGTSLVHLSSGTSKPIASVTKSDIVLCDLNSTTTAAVECLVSMPVPTGICQMVTLEGGLAITPTHPVFDAVMGWVNPRDMRSPSIVECGAEVYNLVLEGGRSVVVNGVECATMGHWREGSTGHEFWGDLARVERCLRGVDAVGFEAGRVRVRGNLRDKGTGRVHGFLCLDGREVVDGEIS